MKQDDERLLLRLGDIQESITGIRNTVSELTFDAYRSDWTVKRAVERGVEIISEAVRHVSQERRAGHPEIPWQEIAAIGNLLRHEYGRVDDHIMWDIVCNHLPALERAISAMTADVERRLGET